jgi:hypothetical protein
MSRRKLREAITTRVAANHALIPSSTTGHPEL